VNLLLDTHALLWWLADDPQLSPKARSVIADPDNTVFLSAVVVWEIRLKQAIGKLKVPRSFGEVLAGQPFSELPVTVAHANALVGLPAVHRDPFDRMLVAQATVERLTIVTRDDDIPRYGIATVTA
jgi:PIN domain nuclease of toxin-antitoxin system